MKFGSQNLLASLFRLIVPCVLREEEGLAGRYAELCGLLSTQGVCSDRRTRQPCGSFAITLISN